MATKKCLIDGQASFSSNDRGNMKYYARSHFSIGEQLSKKILPL